jgi:phage tail sheath protein FI
MPREREVLSRRQGDPEGDMSEKGRKQKPVEIEEVRPATKVITSDPNWKYVNVRRRLTYIEEAIDKGTQWVVFEPNNERLWEALGRLVSGFLLNVWRDGSLMGQKQEEVFFVKCDRTTMTQDDIDNERLILVVGIAPVKPAEFVILRIAQWTAGPLT